LGIDDEFVVGHIGRIAKEKDQLTLIRAFLRVIKEIEKVKLVIVGDGPRKHHLMDTVSKLHLEDKVIFTGSRSDIPVLLSIFDLFVLSSITEGTSLTLLEAMTAKVPIIATDVGGNSNVISNGFNGFLVPSQDPKALAEKIVYLIRNKNIRLSVIDNGEKVIKDRFSIEKMLGKYKEVYQRVAYS
jgi:glycosyltransferase involved in cell wall biosynthesis